MHASPNRIPAAVLAALDLLNIIFSPSFFQLSTTPWFHRKAAIIVRDEESNREAKNP
jgi:hypothetical protein